MRSGAVRYEAVIGLEVHAQLLTHSKAFCGCATTLRRATQLAGVPGLPGPARRPPGSQRRGGPVGGAHGPRALVLLRPLEPLRAQELLLSGPPEGLPDQPVRRAVQRRRAPRDRGRRREEDRRHHARPHGRRRRQERAPRVGVGRRPEPVGGGARRDRRRAGPAKRRRGLPSTSVRSARSSSSSASTTATSKRGAFAATRT